MKNIYIDPDTYDITTKNNNLRMTETTTEWLAAKIEAKLKTFYGEWFANQSIGIPYFEEILKKQVDIDNVQVLFSDEIKNTTGVAELVSFSIDYDTGTRDYRYTFAVLADSGDLVEGESTL